MGDAVACAQGAGDCPVCGAECLPRLGRLYQQINAAPDAGGGDLGVGNQGFGGLAACAGECGRAGPLPVEPVTVGTDQWAQGGLSRRAVHQRA